MEARRFVRRSAVLTFIAVAATCGAPLEQEAAACSCVAPTMFVISPKLAADVPLNAHVRFDGAPTTDAATRLVLRAHGGAEVATRSQATALPRDYPNTELVPLAPLAPNTSYELALVTKDLVPPVRVLVSFRTGDRPDTTPPRLDAPTSTQVFKQGGRKGMCATGTPWAVVKGLHATDPDRPNAQLVYGVWLPGADPRKPPSAILEADEHGALVIGRESICDPHELPLPATGAAVIGIAAIDEAGNTSPLRRVTVLTSSAHEPPAARE